MLETRQLEPRQIEVTPCNWMTEHGVCMLDGLVCDGECENYEPARENRVVVGV